MNIWMRAIAIVLVIGAGTASAATNEVGWTLDAALKQIGRQADDFETVLADVSMAWTDSAGQTVRTGEGRMYMNDRAVMRFSLTTPEEAVVLVDNSAVQVYTPSRSTVDVYSLSKHKERLEPFVPLGFTVSGKDLTDNYLVTLLGEDRMGAARVLGLELTPKKDSIRQTVSKITLWIDEASWMPVRQIINHVSNGEALTLSYAGMARNLNLNDELFDDDWPRGTERVRK